MQKIRAISIRNTHCCPCIAVHRQSQKREVARAEACTKQAGPEEESFVLSTACAKDGVGQKKHMGNM